MRYHTDFQNISERKFQNSRKSLIVASPTRARTKDPDQQPAGMTTAVDSGHLVLRAIKSSVLNRFCYMRIRDAFHTSKIRNRARNLENAMICAR